MRTFLRGCTVILSLFVMIPIVSTLSMAVAADQSIQHGTNKAEISIFSDGFETGDTSRWDHGTSTGKCSATLTMPVDLAD